MGGIFDFPKSPKVLKVVNKPKDRQGEQHAVKNAKHMHACAFLNKVRAQKVKEWYKCGKQGSYKAGKRKPALVLQQKGLNALLKVFILNCAHLIFLHLWKNKEH